MQPSLFELVTTNGPAVGFSKRYPTQAPPQICPGRLEICHGARRVWRTFCRPGTNFCEHYACRGTSLIGATSLSPGTKLVAGTCAVSGYNLSRSQKTVTVQDFNCGQMRVSGCKNHNETVLCAEVKAKSVTSLLTLPSVLATVIISHLFRRGFLEYHLDIVHKLYLLLFHHQLLQQSLVLSPLWLLQLHFYKFHYNCKSKYRFP